MAISINPVLPVIAVQEVSATAPDLALQAGSVVNAQVLKVLSADLVRIAIASLSIDVLTEVPLQEGQTLQLAVSHTQDGVRLAVVGQGADAAGLAGDAISLSPEALVDAAGNPPTITAPQRNVLTPLERAVVSAAAQGAATAQESLAPLFANLGVVTSSGGLPPKLQQAIAQVLAQQTSLDQNLAGSDIKAAFQKSGLFLEASLASGSVPSTATGVPDLKAALIVLRQTLQAVLGTTASAPTPAAVAPHGWTRRRRCMRRQHPALRLTLLHHHHQARILRKYFCRRRGCRSPRISFNRAALAAARWPPRWMPAPRRARP